MWTGIRPTSPPLVSFDQMQAQLAVDSTFEFTYIMDLVDACSEYAESSLDASLLTRTITATFYDHRRNDMFYGCENRHGLFLPRGPVQSITSVTDANGQNITAYEYQRHGNADYIFIRQPCVYPLTVVYLAGYGNDPSLVPSDILMAIRTHVATLWRHRESVSEKTLMSCPHSLESFYANKRRTAPVA